MEGMLGKFERFEDFKGTFILYRIFGIFRYIFRISRLQWQTLIAADNIKR